MNALGAVSWGVVYAVAVAALHVLINRGAMTTCSREERRRAPRARKAACRGLTPAPVDLDLGGGGELGSEQCHRPRPQQPQPQHEQCQQRRPRASSPTCREEKLLHEFVFSKDDEFPDPCRQATRAAGECAAEGAAAGGGAAWPQPLDTTCFDELASVC